MKLVDNLTKIDFNGPRVRSALAWKLILFYITGSSVALVTNIVLAPFGFDFKQAQLDVVLFRILPLAIVLCVIADVIIILLTIKPIQDLLDTPPAPGGSPGQNTVDTAFARGMNLPLFTVFRIEFVHMPIGILSFIIPVFALGLNAELGFTASQHISVVLLAGIMNATIHSIVEYFLVSRLMAEVLAHIQENFKNVRTTDNRGVIFVNARAKFYFIYFFVAVMPLVALGSTVTFKAINIFTQAGLDPGSVLRTLAPWAALLTIIYSTTSMIMAHILSREIIDPVNMLKNSMKEVETGKLDEKLSIITADEFSALFSGFNQMTEGLRERETIKRKFGKYVSKDLLADILSGESVLGGDEKEVTILFSDIRDYTGMSEKMTPSETVDFLNGYFSEMVRIVEECGGVLDKFIGDAVMAVFGLGGGKDHPDNALKAALEMRSNVEEMNLAGTAAGKSRINIGIGMNTGKVLVGNIGSESRMEYTVIGDAVNLASRLESLTKETGCDILFSESVMQRVKNGIDTRHVGQFDIKGKKEPCDVYTLEDI